MQHSFAHGTLARTLHLCCALGLGLSSLLLAPQPATAQQRPSLDVPYIKTPDAVVERMLELGQVGPDDYLIDLGSGDGRIPIAAAIKHGTRGLGVDIDPARTEEARTAAQAADVAGLVKFRTENLFDTDLSQATVISMYLFNEINLRLRPELLKLKPGTRIVAHAFHMEDWKPERHDIVENRDIFLWTVPAQVAGLWSVEVPGHRNFVLRVWQQFDRVQAVSTTMDEHSIPAIEMTVSGPEIRYTLHTMDGEHTYTGTVDGNRMSGTSSVGDWSARKM